MSRREYPGGATPTTITADMTSGTLTATIAASTGWSTGAIGPFTAVINATFPDEEKILVASRSGLTLNIQTRGWDGTTAQSHSATATIQVCVAAVDLDEANAHVNANSGVHGVTGGVVGTTDTQTLSGKTFSDSPTITDHTNMNHDHSSVVQGGRLGGAFAAMTLAANWSAYSSPGYQTDATGWVKVMGAASAASGAGTTVATGLPVPAHGGQVFNVVDIFSVNTVICQVDSSGNLSFNSAGHPVVGHTYYFSGVGFQS